MGEVEKGMLHHVPFDGSEVLAIVDGVMEPCVMGMKWEKSFGGQVEGEIFIMIHDLQIPLEELANRPFDIQLLYCNEAKSKAVVVHSIRLKTLSSGFSIDGLFDQMVYTFKADDVVTHNNYEYNMDKQIAYVQENRTSTDEKTRKLVNLYKSNMVRVLTQNNVKVIPAWELTALRESKAELAKLKSLISR